MLNPQTNSNINCLKGLFPEYIATMKTGIDQISIGIYTLGICFFQNCRQWLNVDKLIVVKKYAELARKMGTAQFRHWRMMVEIIPPVELKLQDVVVCIATTIKIAIPLTKSK